MEKLLAMSILSSTPAEISTGGSWIMNISLFKNNKKSNAPESSNTKSTDSGEAKKPSSSPQGDKRKDIKKTQQGSPWCAPEFDGLNCFETIVSH